MKILVTVFVVVLAAFSVLTYMNYSNKQECAASGGVYYRNTDFMNSNRVCVVGGKVIK